MKLASVWRFTFHSLRFSDEETNEVEDTYKRICLLHLSIKVFRTNFFNPEYTSLILIQLDLTQKDAFYLNFEFPNIEGGVEGKELRRHFLNRKCPTFLFFFL